MEDTHNTVVIYSFSIYYNTITLFIREMMDLALFANYVPALGTSRFCIILKISIFTKLCFFKSPNLVTLWTPFLNACNEAGSVTGDGQDVHGKALGFVRCRCVQRRRFLRRDSCTLLGRTGLFNFRLFNLA